MRLSIEWVRGSVDAFENQFSKKAGELFGSGWVWLARSADGSLSIDATDNGDNPLSQNKQPLLTLDVWEHSYYVDYKNERARYVAAFMRRINWDSVVGKMVKGSQSTLKPPGVGAVPHERLVQF